jgi:alkylated DNA repair dioxygenase AlkB
VENKLFIDFSVQKIELEDTHLLYLPKFLSSAEADDWFAFLINKVNFQSGEIKLFGKTYAKPRLEAFYAENELTYSYSGKQMKTQPFFDEIEELKKRVESMSNLDFNAVLINLYRNGMDSNGWHADNEKELGRNPVIASVSFGAERSFHLQHNTITDAKLKITLENGSLLLMKGETQHFWKHQIPKTAKSIAPRINLTFRIIK